MRHLRHPPLAAWTTLVVLLAGLLAVLGLQGAGSGPRPQVRVPDAYGEVLALRDRAPVLLGLAAAPDERLHTWARDTAAITRTGLARRRAAGVADSDAVSTGYQRVHAHALVLAEVDLRDEQKIRSETKAILAELDRLVGAASTPTESRAAADLTTPTSSSSAPLLASLARSST